jgi:membrane-associated phospholipid phosphatase
MSSKYWVFIMVFALSCKQDHTGYTTRFGDPFLYNKTVKTLNNIVLENNFPPMIAARNYAYANIAAYECLSAGDSTLESLAGRIKDLPELAGPPEGKVIDFQLAALLAFVKVGNAVTFPEGSLMDYHGRLLKLADSLEVPSSIIRSSHVFSDSIAAAILRWSKGDHYAATRGASRYSVNDSVGRWIPTPPTYESGLEPHWREIRPFVLDSAAQFRPGSPPVYDMRPGSVYHQSLMEVKNTVDQLTDEQMHIADFWDDNPFKMHVSGHVMFATKKFSPAGHWMNIVGIAAHKANADFATTVAAYTHTAIALFDGFISCWDEKYRSNYVRPETVINEKISGEWHPYIQTPPFPSYTSGHSTISAAAAEVMTRFFGDQLSFTDTSLLEFGIANREIKSFRQAALEASVSRLYGGIHYRFDLDSGNAAGSRVGKYIVDKLILKKD